MKGQKQLKKCSKYKVQALLGVA